MGKHDWLSVGVKLLGIYFGVTAVATLWNMLLVLIGGPKMEGTGAIGILMPAVYLAAAYMMVCRTSLCLRWCGDGEPQPPLNPPQQS